MLAFPDPKAHFIGWDQLQLGTLQWPKDTLSAHLLPIASGLFIAHQEVLIVDACQMKGKHFVAGPSLPHQTGVTKRSIGAHQRNASKEVVHYMVVGHLGDGIRARLPIQTHSQNHVFVIQFGLRSRDHARRADGMKHPLVDIGVCDNSRSQHQQQTDKQAALHHPVPRGSCAPDDRHRDHGEECKQKRRKWRPMLDLQCKHQLSGALRTERTDHIDRRHGKEEGRYCKGPEQKEPSTLRFVTGGLHLSSRYLNGRTRYQPQAVLPRPTLEIASNLASSSAGCTGLASTSNSWPRVRAFSTR